MNTTLTTGLIGGALVLASLTWGEARVLKERVAHETTRQQWARAAQLQAEETINALNRERAAHAQEQRNRQAALDAAVDQARSAESDRQRALSALERLRLSLGRQGPAKPASGADAKAGPAQQCAPASAAAGVQTKLLLECGAALVEVAGFADQAHAAGNLCQQLSDQPPQPTKEMTP